MSNSITKTKEYKALLDKTYEQSALTTILQPPAGMTKPGSAAGSFLIPKLTLVGLGTYSRASGWPAGDVTLEWEEHTYSQDRGRYFHVDAMDNVETAGQAFGQLAGEFIRKFVVPEVDAYRFATICQAAGTDAYGVIDDSAEWLAAVDAGFATLGDAGVSKESLVLFVSYAGQNYLKNASLGRIVPSGENPYRAIASLDGVPVIPVPSTRFYSGVTMNAGASGSAGGYAMATGAAAINFILMDRSAAFCDLKHAEPKIFSPAVNQTIDSPVNMDSSMVLLPSITTPSTGTFSPGRTNT